MFLNIRLKNFMSFKNIEVSFGSTAPLNYALFYGENGVGKTNLIQSISFLRESAVTMKAEGVGHDGRASGEQGPSQTPNLSRICEEVRTRGSTENMLVRYDMIIGGSKVTYEMEFKDSILVHEVLKVRLNRKIGVLFEISCVEDRIRKYFWDGFITDVPFQVEMSDKVDRFWGKHSFMAIMNREYAVNNRKFLDDRVHRIKDVIEYIEAIRVDVKPIIGDPKAYHDTFPGNLESGTVSDVDLKALDSYGRALKKFFRRIYHNVTDVYYLRTPVENGIRYELMFKRKLDGTIVDIPSVRESSGTRKLVQMFQTLIGCASGQVAFIDEVDSGIHDKLIQDLLPQVMQDIDGQLIITTHNTGLLKTVSPKNVFIIDIDSEGYKRVLNFNSEIRTMANHNNQNRYMNNAVGGVPFIGTVDLRSIAEGLNSEWACWQRST